MYGVPETTVFLETPPGAYGPPQPVVFPSQNYEGPPPPKPKPLYGPPKFHPPKQYGPPKPIYGPPKKTYGPPKQGLPKPNYGAPFKPPKISFPKPVYGPPKPIYGPPKPVYGPPKINYGPPLLNQNIPLDFPQNFGSVGNNIGSIGPISSIGTNFGSLETSVGTSIGTNFDLGLNLPAPIYGTPITSLPGNLKPKFPIPSDHYGPPGHPLGPIGPNDQVVVQDFENIGHYGPPQPDPNPKPPHPGIPAPPTPPHVLYDGWKPIPGVSKAVIESGHLESLDQYGPPPPPPPNVQEVTINLEGHSFSNSDHQEQHGGAQITSGYSSVHQDALANIDLNAIVGGDSNHIDQSKTVFEAHYTENSPPQGDIALLALPERPADTYGAPPIESLSNGPYPPSHRQQGAKGLIPPSGIYGVPPGSQYGAPPKPLPANLPIPYGTFSGGGHSIHTGGPNPRHPIKFRESVPEGLFQHLGHIAHHKDIHGIDHVKTGPAYLPPPIRDVKEQTNHAVNGYSLSIEPSNLYSLPHSGQAITFQQTQPSNLYGSPIDSYSAPLLTVGDHTASGSTSNAVAATLNGMILANLSNLEAAAILKHCPYHEAILKAAKSGEKIPSELASKYAASLSNLGSTLHNYKYDYNTNKDLATASHNIVETVLSNEIGNEKTVKNSVQKGKSIQDLKDRYKQNSISDQIYQTSEKIKNLSEESKILQQKINTASQNLSKFNGQIHYSPNAPNQATYSVQIQSSEAGSKDAPSIPHEQLLSEGLLQSILQAIEQPQNNQVNNNIDANAYQNQGKTQTIYPTNQQSNYQTNSQQNQNIYSNNQQSNENQINYSNSQSNSFSYQTSGFENQEDGLVLPAGYEPIDRNKNNHKDQEGQGSNEVKHEVHNHRGDIPYTECDLRADNSVTHTIVVPPPNVDNVEPVDEVENDVAIYFGETRNEKEEKQEPVTEISVATSISESGETEYDKTPEFGDKIKKT